jgi:ubiquinone/menaquinone biosynthesis C-methylase UbiE
MGCSPNSIELGMPKIFAAQTSSLFRETKVVDIMGNFSPDWDRCKKKVSELNLTEDSMILDIGSKDGEKAHYIIKKGQLTMSDLARRRLAPFVVCDATNLPFKNGAFDLVTMLHVIEHIKNDKLALKEVHRVLKDDAVTLIVTPNAKRFTIFYSLLLRAFKRSPHKYPMNPDHVFEYDSLSVENLFRNSEFQEFKIEPFFMRVSRFLRIRKYCDQWLVTAKK